MTPEIEAQLTAWGFAPMRVGSTWWVLPRKGNGFYVRPVSGVWEFIHRPNNVVWTTRHTDWEELKTAIVAAFLTEQ